MQVVAKNSKVDTLVKKIEELEDDELWLFVCRLLPEKTEEQLEDIFDSLLTSLRRDGPWISAEEVFAEEDESRGIKR